MFRHLTIPLILRWADVYHEATGRWPSSKSGHIAGTVCETWAGVDRALRLGRLTLTGGTTLARLLVERRGARFAIYLPDHSEELILGWMEKHRRQTGQWPTANSGPILGAPFEIWGSVNSALRKGNRGLTRGSSLARLRAERCGGRNLAALPPLTEELILIWIVAQQPAARHEAATFSAYPPAAIRSPVKWPHGGPPSRQRRRSEKGVRWCPAGVRKRKAREHEPDLLLPAGVASWTGR